jgi:hypothetical protein
VWIYFIRYLCECSIVSCFALRKYSNAAHLSIHIYHRCVRKERSSVCPAKFNCWHQFSYITNIGFISTYHLYFFKETAWLFNSVFSYPAYIVNSYTQMPQYSCFARCLFVTLKTSIVNFVKTFICRLCVFVSLEKQPIMSLF